MNKVRWDKTNNNVINWIGLFLTTRLQIVRLGDSSSNWAKFLSGKQASKRTPLKRHEETEK